MTSVADAFAADAASPIHDALAAGVDVLSGDQEICFTPYVRVVLPVDGYVFWLNAALATPHQLANAGLQSPSPISVRGSLHYASQGSMDYDENIVIRRVDLTAESAIDAFAEVAPNVLYLGTWATPWGSFRFSFSSRASYYRQADLHHYVGDAVYPAFEAQLIDSPADFDQRQVVSNSLPIWLAMMASPPYPSLITFSLDLYPAFLVPDNLVPAYGVIDIQTNGTRALQAVPSRSLTGSSSQLAADRVLLTLYGLRNEDVWDLRDYIFDYCRITDLFGLMSAPIIRDAKRTQLELTALAMKKEIEIEVSYYQGRVRNLARQLIESVAPPLVTPSDQPPFVPLPSPVIVPPLPWA